MTQLILLDRDGVINFDSRHYIRCADDWRPIPGALEAIARLHHAGYRLGLCSNQAGVARGKFSADDLASIHAKMESRLVELEAKFDFVAYCNFDFALLVNDLHTDIASIVERKQ